MVHDVFVDEDWFVADDVVGFVRIRKEVSQAEWLADVGGLFGWNFSLFDLKVDGAHVWKFANCLLRIVQKNPFSLHATQFGNQWFIWRTSEYVRNRWWVKALCEADIK